MARHFLLHKQDVFINKDKVDRLMAGKFKTYKDILEQMKVKYGIVMSYKGFFTLLSNKSSWKLLYAMALCEVLETDINTLFEIKEVDLDGKLKKSLEMKNKYSTDK